MVFITDRRIFAILVAVIIAAILIGFAGINKALFMEEACWGTYANDHSFDKLGLLYHPCTTFSDEPSIWPHPPISGLLYKTSTLVFGTYTYALRFIPMIFGLLSLCMVYLICRKFFSLKTALIAVVLMAFSYWHALASLEIDIDGAILTFLFLSFVYAFFMFEFSKEGKKWLIMTGVIFGLSLMTKYTSFIMILTLASYVVAKGILYKRKLSKDAVNVVTVAAIGALVFSIFPILSFATDPSVFLRTISHSSGYAGLQPTIRPLIYLFVFGTPFFIGLTLLAVLYFRKNPKPIHMLLILWVLIPIVLYSLFLSPRGTEGPYEKYLMITIPPMVMLAAVLLSSIKFDKKELYWMLSIFLIALAAIFAVNLQPARYIDHSISSYANNALGLNWDFNFPIMANTEPGFWINFYSLAIVSVASLLLIVAAALLMVAGKKFKAVLIVFIAISFAFNIFFLQEFITSSTHPDISKSVYQTIEYYRESNISGPIYTNALSFTYYLNKTLLGRDLFIYDESGRYEGIQEAMQKNATLIIANYYPTIASSSPVWNDIKKCALVKSLSDKGVTLTSVYRCD